MTGSLFRRIDSWSQLTSSLPLSSSSFAGSWWFWLEVAYQCLRRILSTSFGWNWRKPVASSLVLPHLVPSPSGAVLTLGETVESAQRHCAQSRSRPSQVWWISPHFQSRLACSCPYRQLPFYNLLLFSHWFSTWSVLPLATYSFRVRDVEPRSLYQSQPSAHRSCWSGSCSRCQRVLSVQCLSVTGIYPGLSLHSCDFLPCSCACSPMVWSSSQQIHLVQVTGCCFRAVT